MRRLGGEGDRLARQQHNMNKIDTDFAYETSNPPSRGWTLVQPVRYGNVAARVKERRIRKERIRGTPTQVTYVRRSRSLSTGLLLRQENGRPLSIDELRKSLRASCRIAYVGEGKQRRRVQHVTPYLYRHRYAKRMKAGQAPTAP